MQYINRFNIAIVGNRSEVVLNLIQDRPVFSINPDETVKMEPTSELIAEYALTREVAAELVAKLTELLNSADI